MGVILISISNGLYFLFLTHIDNFINIYRPSDVKSDVYVTGTFDNWTKSTKLFKKRDGPGYLITVEVPNEKNYFKFVVDGSWVTSPSFKIESDENGIENNVLYPEDLVRCQDFNSPPCYKSESESSAFTTVSLSELTEGKKFEELDDDDDDEENSDGELVASIQETLTKRIMASENGAGSPFDADGNRETRYYTSMSLLSRFTRYFK